MADRIILYLLHVDDECEDEKIEKLSEEIVKFVSEKSANEIIEITKIRK